MKIMRRSFEKQKGQALLIVLLIMMVGLTIGLSLIGRSVTDIKMSTQEEESARAFSAAEAGIEAALKGDTVPPAPITIGNAAYSFSSVSAGGSDAVLTLNGIKLADTYTVWLVDHNPTTSELIVNPANDYDGDTIAVCWAVGGTPVPAMEISLVYKEVTDYKIWRGAYDSEAAARGNEFDGVDATIDCGGGPSYAGKTITLPPKATTTRIALRLRPFYNEANVLVKPEATKVLPSQGKIITATGTSGGTTRRVNVIQSFPSLPAIFDYVLFSGTDISKTSP